MKNFDNVSAAKEYSVHTYETIKQLKNKYCSRFTTRTMKKIHVRIFYTLKTLFPSERVFTRVLQQTYFLFYHKNGWYLGTYFIMTNISIV